MTCPRCGARMIHVFDAYQDGRRVRLYTCPDCFYKEVRNATSRNGTD